MTRPLAAVLAVLMLAYPFAVFWAIQHGHLLWLSLALMLIAVLRYLCNPQTLLAPLAGVALVCGALALCFDQVLWLKLYPVLMNLSMLLLFAYSLKVPPSMIERFARLRQADLPPSAVAWTRGVTKLWCGFFGFNLLMAGYTVWSGSMQLWAWYNGCIAYVLIGVLLLAEWMLRTIYLRRTTARS